MARYAVSKSLRDAESARFEFSDLVKTAYVKDGVWKAAYLLCVDCNAKNAFNAYVGFKRYDFYFVGENIVAISTAGEGTVEINGGGRPLPQ